MNETRFFTLVSVLLVIFSVGMVMVGWVVPALMLLGVIVVAGVAIAIVNSRM